MESASKIAMTGYENPGNRGFTLLELLISLTLLSVIAVLVFGALRLGVRAWEKGEATIETRQRERIVMDLLQRQMAS
ncbi:MAG TPA: prepilin-type N-terminal cleavage/methylation domain-containing protein, partial [Syntrophales bacterium]|nr:prepilin-type N-terminal cleavage/methylation domain-containing protein [Syntrophales bacterium]